MQMLFSPKEASQILGVSYDLVRDLIEEATFVPKKSRWKIGREIIDLSPINTKRRTMRINIARICPDLIDNQALQLIAQQHILKRDKRSKPLQPEALPGYVYVLKHKSLDMYKIGVTRNLKSRLRELKVNELTDLVDTVWTSDPMRMEKKLHAKYSSFRVPQSEWFELTEAPDLNLGTLDTLPAD